MYRAQCGPWCSLFGLVPCWHGSIPSKSNSFTTHRICESQQSFAKWPQKIVYEDILYGKLKLPKHVVSIIETPLFQRLKGILQLSTMKFLYPELCNNRYEHCIGTYKRASELLDSLELTLPCREKKVPEDYRMAVEIAALLHDVGHGPFSHTWEHLSNTNFRHEQNGLNCIDELIPEAPEFECLHEHDKYGIELIKALIVGDKSRLPEPLPVKWHFIFDIVNNKRCGLDVDKWDYLKRDGHYMKQLLQTDVDFDDVFLKARVAPNGECIQYRYEDFDKIYKLFHLRWTFYVRAYRLPKVCALERLLINIINETPATLDGIRLGNVEAKNNLRNFCALNDEKVLSLIKHDSRFQYFEEPELIVPVDEATAIAVAQQTPKKVITINESIPGPGVMMPPDEHFQFFGNECNKPAIVRDNSSTKILKYFLLK